MLSWLEEVEAGHRFMAAEFDGRAFGPARSISAGDRFFANWADTPGVRVGADGTWLAHWLVRSGLGTYAYDVMMALSPDGGITWSEPFLPHDDGTLTEHGFVSTFLDPHNQSGIGAVWLDERESRAMLRVARFDLAGQLLEQHDLMPLDEGRISGVPRILGLDDGRVLFTWTESSAESGQPRVRTGFLTPP